MNSDNDSLISDRYHRVLENIQKKCLECGRKAEDVTLIVVTKSHSIEAIHETYHLGARHFGESRLQEALEKIPALPENCHWHLIGRLQSNKIAKALQTFSLIHSVDTLELAEKISKASELRGVMTSILLQVNTSGEESKQGLSPSEWEERLEEVNDLPNITIEGLMTMAPLTNDIQRVRVCFRELYRLREKWRSHMREPQVFRHLSMGMSDDYLIAIEEGATLLRIGSAIFIPL